MNSENIILIACMIFVLLLCFIESEYKKSKQALIYSAIQNETPEDIRKLIVRLF